LEGWKVGEELMEVADKIKPDTDTITSINPFDLSVIGEVKAARQKEINEAIQQAQRAYRTWKRLAYQERSKYLLRFRDIILNRLDEIASLITQETGKPISEALPTEILPALETLTYFAENAERLLSDERIEYENRLLARKRGYTTYEPLGVIGIISPWNYPLAIPVSQIATALITGNTVILKPSELACFVGLKISEIAKEVGLPEGVLTVLPGDKLTGKLLSESDVNKVIFTGKTTTGKSVLRVSAERILPVTLELSGKDPMIVLSDANLSRTIKGAVYGAFIDAGQSCCAVERVYVMWDIAESFIAGVVQQVNGLTVGDPAEPDTEIGPLVSEEIRSHVESHVADAIQKGAKVLTGGVRPDKLPGYFYLPTVLTSVDHSMLVMQEETLGPVMPIMVVDSTAQAIELANDSKYGLSASVWASDANVALEVAHKLEAGTVIVNDVLFTFGAVECAWGGTKESGIGRTQAVHGLREVCNVKHISYDSGKRNTMPLWYPYDEKYQEFMNLVLKREYSHDLRTRFKSSSELLSHWRRIVGKRADE